MNLREGDIIQALNDLPLHLIDFCHVSCHMKTELCHTPVLLDEVELAMVFQVKVAKMTMRFDQLLKLGLLRDEIRLQKQDVLAAAVYMARGAAKTWALGEKTQVSLGP